MNGFKGIHFEDGMIAEIIRPDLDQNMVVVAVFSCLRDKQLDLHQELTHILGFQYIETRVASPLGALPTHRAILGTQKPAVPEQHRALGPGLQQQLSYTDRLLQEATRLYLQRQTKLALHESSIRAPTTMTPGKFIEFKSEVWCQVFENRKPNIVPMPQHAFVHRLDSFADHGDSTFNFIARVYFILMRPAKSGPWKLDLRNARDARTTCQLSVDYPWPLEEGDSTADLKEGSIIACFNAKGSQFGITLSNVSKVFVAKQFRESWSRLLKANR
ncbi:hypothetical protein sr12606 [Sporisorium reilianum SRZ2]|uniref:Uncharacterized protein n=2 Tax=Sporisorium reilianum TaxID=72558 RepID=E6ZWZ3_SPORE|nr:hypothetical protein sr12606 [Sporisorium reilianum SRZ2]SJX61621.1 uncharacterized protein SRS1_12606 [Sporisorium reilianum f. sp. reilianum]